MNVVAEGGEDGAEAEAERDGGQIPAGTDELAQHVRRNLKDNVGDVEDGEDLVVVVTHQLQVLLEAGKLSITCDARGQRRRAKGLGLRGNYRYLRGQ